MSSNSHEEECQNSGSDQAAGRLPSDIEAKFPLHFNVWHNNIHSLSQHLSNGTNDLELRDTRGRTPLLLAITLGHLESTRVLLAAGCSTQAETSDGWNVVQEAVSCGDPELLSLILTACDAERHSTRALGIPHLLHKLAQAPDFYVEMKWEFTSWVPLVSRMCPSDTYRVFKQGSSVRIDTTLLGFQDSQWQRGSRSYIFRGQGDDAIMYEVDHDKKIVYVEKMENGGGDGSSPPSESLITYRLTTPNVSTTIDTDKISFERDKSGFWGWRADKMETINGHDCKVFSATSVEIVTRTRTEHMTAADKQRTAAQRSPLHSILAMAEGVRRSDAPDAQNACAEESSYNPCSITAAEYFDENCELGDRDIGRPKEMTTKLQKFKAVLWLAEEYPLRLQEQVMPIVDLMALSSTHFAKLQHFIQMQLPSGFPVKIEIPLFHVLTARITFGNIFGLDSGVEGVTSIAEPDRLACVLDQDIFQAPPHYRLIGAGEPQVGRSLALEEDEAMLQFALQQSLLGANGPAGPLASTMDVWEALRNDAPQQNPEDEGELGSPNGQRMQPSREALLYAAQNAEQTDLQRAIEESLMLAQLPTNSTRVAAVADGSSLQAPTAVVSTPSSCSPASSEGGAEPQSSDSSDADLALALALSRRQLQEDEHSRARHEEQLLQHILKLSMEEQ
ncbi:ankyrin repeat domain-containing protein 13D [Hyalella azteca]|uniref:Ankyrin repeat domain-containing protein 13D n=1 Tax=Hyalella azteca TaxID=294128 RepID=A0A8B7MZ72_HYAAZ|nr:ankyrin repeat domain-containing protein 13D [Hyalella azteca]